MLGCSIINYKWMDQIEKNDNIIVVAEGLTMYLSEKEIKDFPLNN